MYFLAAIVVLIVTSLLIIGGIAAIVYMVIRMIRGNRERYFQFEERNQAIQEDKQKHAAVGLSKIEEEPDEEYQSTTGGANKGTFENSRKSSVATTG